MGGAAALTSSGLGKSRPLAAAMALAQSIRLIAARGLAARPAILPKARWRNRGGGAREDRNHPDSSARLALLARHRGTRCEFSPGSDRAGPPAPGRSLQTRQDSEWGHPRRISTAGGWRREE